MFSKMVGKVKAEASDGWPVWVDLSFPHNGCSIRLCGSGDLRDLKYAVERALEYVDAEEKRGVK